MNPASPGAVLEAIGLPGGTELLLVLLIAVVLFGHTRIPKLGAALGGGIRNFRRSMSAETPAQLPPARRPEEERTERSALSERTQDRCA